MPFKLTGNCRLRSKDGKFKPRNIYGFGVGVGVGVRVVVDTTVSITVSEATTSATVDVATTSSIAEVAVFVGSVLEGMMEVSINGGVVETLGGAAVEETAAGVDTATVVVDTTAHIIVKILLSNYLLCQMESSQQRQMRLQDISTRKSIFHSWRHLKGGLQFIILF